MDLNKNELISQIEQLKKENAELLEQKDAYVKKSEYLSKELAKATKDKSGHLSTLEIVTDLALTICIALLMTIAFYMNGAHDMGFIELIKNAFSYIF